MDKSSFFYEFAKMAENIDEKISNEELEKFYQYMLILLEWNEKMNLTAITEPKEIILKHFIDSITINRYIKQANTLIDVGTGAGFPGIPLKIVNPEKEFVLLDSLGKRINFLKDVCEKLDINKISCIHGRAEELAIQQKYREKYDAVTSRAVAKLNVLLEYMLPFVKIGGVCICMKGPSIFEELEEAKGAIKILGGELEKVENLLLPASDIERNIIIIKKINNTPNKYPRKAGTPVKQPLM